MGVGMPQALLLQQFGNYAGDAFGHTPYHVGSSLKNKDGWRDVDVRVLIPDDEYAAMGLGEPGFEHNSPRWRAVTLAWSAFGKALTGLPIDFQLQQLSHANAKYPSPRSALFDVSRSIRSQIKGDI